MADPRVFDTSVSVARDEAMAAILALLADVPDAQQTFAERYGNPNLLGSSATLLEAARDDHQVRDTHGLTIMVQAFAHVLTAQQTRIEELEVAVKTSKPKDKTKR
jgi:hypothetical protein